MSKNLKISLQELPLINNSHLNVNNTFDSKTRAVSVPYCVLRYKKKGNSYS